MPQPAVDAGLVRAWLAGRSLARRLPAPIADRGGFRVETGSEEEVRRWVFATVGPGLVALGQEITARREPIKLCAPMAVLLAALPDGWAPQPAAWFMRATGQSRTERALADGYTIDVARAGAVSTVHIIDSEGELAASGHAAETAEAFVYDRIVTAEGHRRRGLGAMLMTTLARQRRDTHVPELLTATTDGLALYRTLGWEVLSDYSTAVRL